jgi:hypothetical protein
MKIQVLGIGCAPCGTLMANAEQAVRDLELKKVETAGRLPFLEEIKEMLLDSGGQNNG